MLRLHSAGRLAFVVLLASVLQLFVAPHRTYAQGGGTISGGISGRVVDETGALLPGATVTATNRVLAYAISRDRLAEILSANAKAATHMRRLVRARYAPDSRR